MSENINASILYSMGDKWGVTTCLGSQKRTGEKMMSHLGKSR